MLVIGDSCEDVFIYGKCERLCPDAPVPVFIPTRKKKNGGMALNVFENLKSLGIHTDILTNKTKITKTRYIDEKTNQLIIRVDSENKKFDRITNVSEIKWNIYDGIIISDYNKGFLSHEDIKFICSKHKNIFIDTKKIIDVNFKNCKFIKINESEYNFNLSASKFIDTLKDKLIITLGNKGAKYKNHIFPVEKVTIKDMVGAGDTFISSLAYKFILTNDIEESIKFANKCATIIVQQKGVNKIGDFIKI